MATAGKGQNKSAFLRELFEKNPSIKEAEATEAWQKAGNEGVIGSSLYYNVKRASKGEVSATAAAPVKPKPKSVKGPKARRTSGPTVGARPGSEGESAPSKPVSGSRPGDRERVLDQADAHIDDLLFLLKTQGGLPEAEAKLREVRRMLYRGR